VATEKQKQEINAMVEKWRAATSAIDVRTLKGLWDQKDPSLVYIAEENDKALMGWPAISNYYDSFSSMANADWKYSDLVVDVAGDVAYAFCYSLGRADIKPEKRRFEYDMRITFVFRKAAGQWKIIHFHESPNPRVGPGGRAI